MALDALVARRVPERARGGDDAQLLERYHRERRADDREALIERFLPLAQHLSRRYGMGSEREDLEQVAALGLLKAIDRFDAARGIAFTSFATPTILGELKRYFRDLGWAVRVPRDVQELALRIERVTEELTGRLGRAPTSAEVAAQCRTTVERVLEARATATAHRPASLDETAHDDDEHARVQRLAQAEPGFARVERSAYLDQVLATLPERDEAILRLRFQQELTQREIGERLGLSQMQISRLLRSAIAELQRRFGPAPDTRAELASAGILRRPGRPSL